MRTETEAGPVPAPRWAAARTAGLIVLLLAAQAGWNYAENPLGLYGDHRGAGGRRDQRWVKVEQLLAADRATEVLVLGSSRVRNLDPEDVKRLFGRPAFNCASGGGGVQDWLAFARLAVDELKMPVRLIVIGVDAGSFVHPSLRMDHPVDVARLRPHLNHPYLTWVSTRRYLWSPYQTRRSWEQLQKRMGWEGTPAAAPDNGDDGDDFDYPLMLSSFSRGWRADGFNPLFPPTPAERLVRQKRNFFRRHTRVDPDNLRDFASILELGQAKGITVLAFITPDHPELAAALAETPMAKRQAETKAILKDFSASGLVFCDLDGVEFNWDSFVDLDHGDAIAGRAILERLQTCAYWAAPR